MWRSSFEVVEAIAINALFSWICLIASFLWRQRNNARRGRHGGKPTHTCDELMLGEKGFEIEIRLTGHKVRLHW